MTIQTTLLEQQISNVSATAFITLFARATEAQTAHPIIEDPQAVALADQLRPVLAQSDRGLCRQVAAGKIEPLVVVTMALRARRFDAYVHDFCSRHAAPVIVNLGCGLDTRFFRVDDGHMMLFDLDLPPMIDLKRALVPEQPRYHFLAASVLETEWMNVLAELGRRPLLFLAEGLFMYLDPADVQKLVVELSHRFPGSELVCEVFGNFWLRKPWKGLVDRKMQRRLNFGADAMFRSGVDNARHFERWDPAIHFLDDWSYFDEDEPKMKGMHWLRHIGLVRQVQWSLHYRFGEESEPAN